MKTTRRQMLAGLACVPPCLIAGCNRGGALPFEGRLIGPSVRLGHQLRDGVSDLTVTRSERSSVVIVGGGVAGLSAAWQLQRDGLTDFRVLELESIAGGTSRSGRSQSIAFPWGAHYLPLPMKENRDLIELLDEMGVIESFDGEGTPAPFEQFLCRDPEERIFFQGQWYEGLYPFENASQDDFDQLAAFEREVGKWVQWRDDQARRAFAIPIRDSSDADELRKLDKETMAHWMDRLGFDSPRLRWLVDYSCRDDYGLTLEQTSAWAALFYFASRKRTPEVESQPLLTWPEGNGRLVSHLSDQIRSQLVVDCGVASIRKTDDPANRWSVIGISSQGEVVEYFADSVVFAAPQFLVPYVVKGIGEPRRNAISKFGYGAWLVANLFLKDRPEPNGFTLSWDNVLFDSPALGYVVATHQKGIDYGPTVWTYYYPFCHDNPRQAREELLGLDWEACARLVITDLEQAHPELQSFVERLDVMRWGHAMIQPRPGFIWGGARHAASQPIEGLHFANTDLSGIALFEEAFDHGVRAAREIMAGKDQLSIS